MSRLGRVRRPEWRSHRAERAERAERAWRRRALEDEVARARTAGGAVPPPEMHR